MSEPPTTPPTGPPPSWSAAPPAPPVEQWRGTPYDRRAPGTNGFAIASLVLGMIGGVLLSVVFGFVALGQVRRSGQAGRGLAVAGLVLSGLWVVGILAFVAFVVAGSAARVDAGSVGDTGAGAVSTTDLRIGDCVGELTETDDLGTVPAVPCDAPHHGEVFARFDLADGDYPAESELDRLAGTGCFDRLADYAPAAVDDPAVDVFYSFPQALGWRRGDHEVMCFAVATEGTLPAGSVADRVPPPVDA